MPSNKITTDSYNDGILFYGEVKTKLDNQARKIGEEFVLKGKLFYECAVHGILLGGESPLHA